MSKTRRSSAAVWTVAGKELTGFFNQPTAYIALIVFLAVAFFLYFRTVFVVGEASLRPLFEILPWLLMFFVPAITMRSFAEEKREGTLETLLTAPLEDWEIVVGKFLGNFCFMAVSLALTLPLVITLKFGGTPDLGAILGQYLGALFLLASLTALGLFFSSRTRNQIVAFILSLVSGFVLMAIGLEIVVGIVPFSIGNVLSHLSLMTHFTSIARGVVDSRDIIYFLAAAACLLFLTWFFLRRTKTVAGTTKRLNLDLGLGLFLAILILVDLISLKAYFRVDMTASRIFSVSPASREILSELPDVVNIELYRSQQLPSQVQLLARGAEDFLSDYERYGKGKVKFTVNNPDSDSAAKSAAEEMGIQAVQFNVVSQDEYQVKQGYLGLAVRYGSQKEVIPFIGSTDDLEYRVTSFIDKLVRPRRKTVAFLTGHGEKTTETDLKVIYEGLGQRFQTKTLDLKKDKSGLSGIDALLIVGGNSALSKKDAAAIAAWQKKGGAVLLAADKLNIMTEMMFASPLPAIPDGFLPKGSVKINSDLVYDPEANMNVTVGGGSFNYVIPYPFWISTSTTGTGGPFGAPMQRVVLPWASSLTLGQAAGYKVAPLLETSRTAGVQTGQFNIDPRQELKATGKQGTRIVAATVIGQKDGSRTIVVSDSDLLTEQFMGEGSDNGNFALGAVDWLTQEKALSSIKAKSSAPKPLAFGSTARRETFKYLNLVGVPLFVAAYGAWRIIRRQRRMKESRKEITGEGNEE